MSYVAESSADVVALLLDDLAPPRLGTLLRGARKARGLTRRDVAGRVGTTAGELRRYERGDEPVPPSLVASLAECYGEALTDQLATRAPARVEKRYVVVGDKVGLLDTADDEEILGKYVELVARVRQAQPGEPIALRADDVVALSTAIGQETEHVEARIVELLGCTPREAHSLHAEMLRRKLVLPVAGFVAGLAIIGGVGVASASNSSPAPAGHRTDTVEHAQPASHDVAVPTTAAPTPTTAPAATPKTMPAEAAPTTTVAPVEHRTSSDTSSDTDEPGTVAPAAEPAVHPVVTPDTTPMSIPPNETVTIIQP